MANLQDITAVVLAGGMGTRLRSVVADRPKVLAKVNGRPFLYYLLDQLTGAGCRRVVLGTGYMADAVSALLGTHYGEAELLYSVEANPLGTGGAVRLALSLLSSDPVLVLNGDSYCDVDLSAFLVNHVRRGAAASMALTEVLDISRYGAVEVSAAGAVTAFVEKGGNCGKGLINAGIYLLPCAAIAAIPFGEAFSLERDLFPALIDHGLYGYATAGKFIDIGVPRDYEAAAAFFATIPIAARDSHDHQ